jgi:hypothetical protein
MKPMTTEQMATYLENCVAVCPPHGQEAITAIARRLRLLEAVVTKWNAWHENSAGAFNDGCGCCMLETAETAITTEPDLSKARQALDADEREGCGE